jgi:small subunit ribosomal protein S7
MPRKGPVAVREIAPDPLYNSKLIGQLVNKVLRQGKKGIAESIVYKTLDIIRTRTGDDPLITCRKAIENVQPTLEVKPRRVGGATYQVPVEVSNRRAVTLAIRWIVNFARVRREKTMPERLAAEIIEAANNTGSSIKKKEDLHKMAEANRAFAHYRW